MWETQQFLPSHIYACRLPRIAIEIYSEDKKHGCETYKEVRDKN
jgi:hypothetical protein